MFEKVDCVECGKISNQHRCLMTVTVSGYTENKKQICGQPFCIICATKRNCVECLMRCEKHNVVDA